MPLVRGNNVVSKGQICCSGINAALVPAFIYGADKKNAALACEGRRV